MILGTHEINLSNICNKILTLKSNIIRDRLVFYFFTFARLECKRLEFRLGPNRWGKFLKVGVK